MQTLTNYILQVRDRLDEANAARWTDAQLTRWINEGAADVARKSECLFTRGTVSIGLGVQEVTAPTDVVRVHRVEYNRTGDSQKYALEYRDWNTMDEIWWTQQSVTQSSNPSYFTMWGYPPTLSILVYPTPSANGSLKVFYFALPNTLSAGSDVLNLPNGWENLVVAFAEYTALRSDGDPRWTEAKQLYEGDLTSIIATTTRFSDQEGQFVPDQLTGGMVPAWLWNEEY